MDTTIDFDVSAISEVKVRELFRTYRPEDAELAGKVSYFIEKILREIDQALPYLVFPILITFEEPRSRVIKNWYGNNGEYSERNDCDHLLPLEIPKGLLTDPIHKGHGELFLNGKGGWIKSFECNSKECIAANGKHYHGRQEGPFLWAEVPFHVIIELIITALEEAPKRRKEHLDAIWKSSPMLDEIKQALTDPSQKPFMIR